MTAGKVYRLNLEGQVGDDTSKGTLTDPDLADRVAWVNSLNMTAVSYNSFVSHNVNGANNDSALYKPIRTGAHYFAVSHRKVTSAAFVGTYTFTVTEEVGHIDDCRRTLQARSRSAATPRAARSSFTLTETGMACSLKQAPTT